MCVSGPSPGDGVLFHVRLTGGCSSSRPHPVSSLCRLPLSVCAEFTSRVHSAVTHPLAHAVKFTHSKRFITTSAVIYNPCVSNSFFCVVLKMTFSYLMVSSLVGFYSSPLFTGLLPRAKDTNVTQVSQMTASVCMYTSDLKTLWAHSHRNLCLLFQIIANCMSLLILSSALPVFSRTLGKDMTSVINPAFLEGWSHFLLPLCIAGTVGKLQ